MKRIFFVLVLGFSGLLKAEGEPTDFLTLTSPKVLWAKAGKPITATLSATTKNPFHIQANPVGQPNLIPTELKMDKKEGFSFADPTYPPGKPYRLKGSDRDILAYEGTFEVKVAITPAAGLKPGKYDLPGVLKFQACNEKICFFPAKLPVTIPVQVMK